MDHGSTTTRGRQTARLIGVAGLLGIGLGGFLARARAPLFPDILDLSGPDPVRAAATRGVALAAAALLVLAAGPVTRLAPGAFIAGAAAGVASALLDSTDGGLLVSVAPPWVAAGPWLILATVAAALSRRQLASATASRAARPLLTLEGGASAMARSSTEPAPWALSGGVLIASSGVALGLEGLSRLALRLGLATRGEDILLTAVLAAVLALGGVVFGRATSRPGDHRCAALLLGAGVLGVAALALAGGIAEPLGFKALCARIHADASLAGTPRVGAFVALVVLVLPALAAGTAVHVARRPTTLAAMLLGAALGVAAAPGLLEVAPVEWARGEDAAGSAGLVRLGALIAGLGALLHAALHPGAGRLGLIGASVGVVLGSALLPVSPIPVLDPWERFPVQPIALFETPDGQFSVVPTGAARRRVTLDQRALSPRSRELSGEAARLRASIEAAGDEPVRRLLLVGLLTPERAQLLAALGVTHVDRTAGWWRSMPLVESVLGPSGVALTGEVLSPTEARRRASRGDHNLVLAVGTGATGPLPPSLGLRVGGGSTPVIAWRPASRPAAHLPWPDVLVRSTDGLLHHSFAWTDGEVRVRPMPSGPIGDLSWWRWLQVRPDSRAREATGQADARIASSRYATPMDRGLALHALAQTQSSPFESAVARIELEDAALDEWREAAVGNPALTRFERGVIEGAVRVLVERRLIPELLRFTLPIAEAHPGWPALELALVRADLEELNPEAALARLAVLIRAPATRAGAQPEADQGEERLRTGDRETALLLAATLLELGRPGDAAAALALVAEARPGDLEVGLRRADALVAADDPRGRELAARLFAEHPGHPELFGLAQGMRGMTTLNPDPGPGDQR